MFDPELSTAIVIAVFAFTYAGMALGRVPGLRLERTGIALLGVAVLLAAGVTDLTSVGGAQDVPTLVLLFALMIVSAQLSAAGFYDLCARRIVLADVSPAGLLAMTVIAGGVLSAVLANDIVVFAMTPLLCQGIARRGLDPRPYLLALAGSSNAGSAATLIGNPQNILIGELADLDFWHFLYVCGPPAAVSMIVVYMVVRFVWRDALAAPAHAADDQPLPDHDRAQIAKGLIVVAAMVILFATPLPRAVSALALAALLLISRRVGSRWMLGAVDWHLLLLIACLFAVTSVFAGTGLAADLLGRVAGAGLLPDSLHVMAPLTLLLSNGIGNVPAVILITTVWPDAGAGAYYGLALLSTLAGNLLLVGSLANLIVAERAKAEGVVLGFAMFAKTGIPMTLVSMGLASAWLWAGGWMPF